jgi:hypothetical protein
MGKTKPTLVVRSLISPRVKGGGWAVYRNSPTGAEWRIPHTDCNTKAQALKKAKALRKKAWMWK